MNYTYNKIWLISFTMMSFFIGQQINIPHVLLLGHVGDAKFDASALVGVLFLVIYILSFGVSWGCNLQLLAVTENSDTRKRGKRSFKDRFYLNIKN